MKRQLTYFRQLSTGEFREMDFDATHARWANILLGETQFDFIKGQGIQRLAALELLNHWNINNTVCRYWLPKARA